MMKAAKSLRPDVLNQWDLDPGRGSTVESVKIIPRPGMRYDTVQVKFQDGTYLRPFPTVDCKLEVQ